MDCAVCYNKLSNTVFVECNNEKCKSRMCVDCYFKYPDKCPLCTLPRESPHKIITGKTLLSALKRRWKRMGFDIRIDHMEGVNLSLLHYLKVCPLESKDIDGVEQMLQECPYQVGFHVKPHDGRADTTIYGRNLKGVLVSFDHESGYLVAFFL